MRSSAAVKILDCSRPGPALFWFVIGASLAVGAMRAQNPPNLASLLRVGSTNPLLAQIEQELGPIESPDSVGHDGQIYYLIARDPWATGPTVAALSQFDTNPPRYRYRRILYPLLVGGFGQFDGRTTLFSMILWVAISMGVATVATADLTFHLRGSARAALIASVNVGALVSAMLLTADMLALALALLGLTFAARERRTWAIAAFAVAGLTKELYLFVPLSVALWHWMERRRAQAVVYATLPLLPLIVWAIYVSMRVPDLPIKVASFGVPMVGILTSIPQWRHRNGAEQLVGAYVGVSFVTAAAMVVAGRAGILRWVLAPWLTLGLVATEVAVWDIPSNVARQFAILWPVGMLLVSQRMWAQAASSGGASTKAWSAGDA